ncbi:MAG: hypothetical protein WKF37_11360 [Bryobacteraceae bacterium]
MQHINVKIFARENVAVKAHDAINVFHRWIQDGVEESLFDVADYSHVPLGPGILLIGHDAFYSLDYREGRLGFLYNRRTVMEGSTEDKIRHAYDSALRACRRLEQEPEFAGKLHFDEGNFEIFVNDRLVAPNEESTWTVLRPEVESVFGAANVKWRGASRDLFRVQVSV